MIGGISYFHEFAYDLLAENERILAATFDAAIAARRNGHLERIIVIVSSMVFESATVFPTPEGAQLDEPAAALDLRVPEARQRVLRPGRPRAVRPALHDRPAVQLRRHRRTTRRARHRGHERQHQARAEPRRARPRASRSIKGQDPLHILGDGRQVRHYTYGGDLAHGIRLAMESPLAVNNDFNLSTARSTTVLRARRDHLADGERRPAVPDRLRSTVRARRPDAVSPTRRRRATCSASRPPHRSRRCSTRSSRGSGPKLGGPNLMSPDEPGCRSSSLSTTRGRRSSAPPASDSHVAMPNEILVVYDFDEDTTVAPLRTLVAEMPNLRPLRNELGRGALNALKAGIAASRGTFVLVTMADGSDELEAISRMLELARWARTSSPRVAT